MAYADYIDVMGRSENDVKEAFTALYHSAEEIELRVNEETVSYTHLDVYKRQPIALFNR